MARRQPLSPPVLSGYTYIRPLGSGGFADVFLYQQDMPHRLVAVKVLLSRIEDETAARAFAAEADTMASLSSHPAILTVYQASVSADGRPYLVVEFCPTSLTNRYRNERMAVGEVLSIGVKLASAVEAAHRAGMLHRDIKPSNILVTAFGHPVLSDFGVASALANGEEETIAMSPPWSAPEVVERRTSGTVASEVWALAATVYTLLAQRAPFDLPDGRRGDEQQLRSRIARAKYTPTGRPDVPPSLERVLEGGMRRLPGDRYPTALAVGQALREVEAELGLSPTPLDVPTDEWAQAAVLSRPEGEGLQPTRSVVQVESKRQRRDLATGTHRGTATRRESTANRVGRTVAIIAGVVAAAGLGAAVTVVILLGAEVNE